MGDLTLNISRHELICKGSRKGICDCKLDSMDWKTIEVVQKACNYFAKKLNIPKVTLVVNSAARCREYNKFIGGAERSQHPRCRAIDHYIKEIPIQTLHRYYIKEYPNTYGIGLYQDFVHIDTREECARW